MTLVTVLLHRVCPCLLVAADGEYETRIPDREVEVLEQPEEYTGEELEQYARRTAEEIAAERPDHLLVEQGEYWDQVQGYLKEMGEDNLADRVEALEYTRKQDVEEESDGYISRLWNAFTGSSTEEKLSLAHAGKHTYDVLSGSRHGEHKREIASKTQSYLRKPGQMLPGPIQKVYDDIVGTFHNSVFKRFGGALDRIAYGHGIYTAGEKAKEALQSDEEGYEQELDRDYLRDRITTLRREEPGSSIMIVGGSSHHGEFEETLDSINDGLEYEIRKPG